MIVGLYFLGRIVAALFVGAAYLLGFVLVVSAYAALFMAALVVSVCALVYDVVRK